jgi:glycosyltransferase involved in cell wall biosynthesis
LYYLCILYWGSLDITEIQEKIHEQKNTSLESIKTVESILEEKRERYLELAEQAYPRKKVTLVACIPAYNDEKTIGSIILKTQRHVDQVVVCDDRSTDLTAEIAEKLGALVIKHESNQGKEVASKSALKYALNLEPDYLVMLDSDGQHDPDEIPLVVESLRSGEADIVIGSRYIAGNNIDVPLYRKIGLKVIDVVFKNSIKSKAYNSQSGFRAFTRGALEQIIETSSKDFGLEIEQIHMATLKDLRIIEAPVNVMYRDQGKTSKNNPFKGTEILDNILKLIVTKRSVELLGFPGLVSIGIGILSTILFLYDYNTGGYFSVPLALISTATILFGSQLLVTGLILYTIIEMKKQ